MAIVIQDIYGVVIISTIVVDGWRKFAILAANLQLYQHQSIHITLPFA